MNPRYMLDTNICIYLMKHQPPQVQARFNACFVGEVVMSAITLAELEYGIVCSSTSSQAANRAALDGLIEDIPVVSFAVAAAKSYGPVRASDKHRNRDALDKLIAAHALSLGVILVTNNEADFNKYEGLVVENWVTAH